MQFLADMALFVELARSKHFGRAAKALNMPPSSLSRRITALERELGVSLINRSTRSFALTEAGHVYSQRAEKLVADAKRLREEVAQSKHTLSGSIRIGLPTDLAMTLFFPIFAAFARTNPGVSLEIVTIDGYPDLLANALDIAFVVAHQIRLPDSSHPTRRIGAFSRMVFASKPYLKRRGVPQQPCDLANHNCLLFQMGTAQKQCELRRRKEKQTVTLNGTCSANSVGVLAQFAREHLGVVILPKFLAYHPTFGGGLEQILPEWEASPAHIFALTASQLIPAKVSKLIDACKSSFNERLSRLEGLALSRSE